MTERDECCDAGRGETVTGETIERAVRDRYGAVAASELTSEHEGVRAVAEAFGYSPDELAAIPAEANMGLSCGNPTATAHLRAGEVVVDLGSGGGLDVFLAAGKVGPEGRAIGIDMTPEMVERARAAAARGVDGVPYENVEFHLGTIDDIPLPDDTADCVISNCVINLAPDKRAVFREIHRILKPGGRVAVSDIALKQALPEDLARDVGALVGCIAGAIPIEEYRAGLEEAGFGAVEVVDTGRDLNAYSKLENQAGCCSPAMNDIEVSSCCAPPASAGGDPRVAAMQAAAASSSCCGSDAPAEVPESVHESLARLLEKYDVNDYAASVRVYAVK